MLEVLKGLLSSKKAVVFFTGLLVSGLGLLGLEGELATQWAQATVALTASYLVGQGLADVGKEAKNG